VLLHAPLLLASALLLIASLAGALALVRDGRQRSLLPRPRPVATVAACALATLIPLAVLGSTASVQLGVPNYANDAAFHVETIDALRRGAAWAGWYPPGSHAVFAAYLALLPGVDSAAGAAGASLVLALAAPLTLFAVAWSAVRDLRVASAAALVSALTFHYPYSPHFWSFWPLAWGTLLALALLAVALEYTRQADVRLALAGGVLAAGILLVHGTEVYTVLVGVGVIVLARWRQIHWRQLVPHLACAFGAAVLLAGAYLPVLLGWAGGGGVGDAALAEFGTRSQGALRTLDDELLFWSNTFSAGIVIDAPVRLALLGAGTWFALRRREAGVIVGLLVGYSALNLVLRYVDVPPVQRIFELTFPWGLTYRLASLPSAMVSLVEGAGCVLLWTAVADWRPGLPAPARRWCNLAATATACLGLTATAILLGKRVDAEALAYLSYSPDDAVVMAWLNQHADKARLLANDGPEDGGIWAPYKAGLRVLNPRLGSVDPQRATLIEAHAAELDRAPDAREAVCATDVGYVYRGTLAVPLARHLPTLDQLRSSAGLEELFQSGRVGVFKVQVRC
jgi:hypothetical protein